MSMDMKLRRVSVDLTRIDEIEDETNSNNSVTYKQAVITKSITQMDNEIDEHKNDQTMEICTQF